MLKQLSRTINQLINNNLIKERKKDYFKRNKVNKKKKDY
jgi:hypothetical protein